MKRNIKTSVFLILFLVSFYSFACTCLGKLTLKESFKQSDVIFWGEVKNKKLISIKNPEVNFTVKYYKVSFEVKEIFKGRIKKDTITILTGIGGGDCGYHFKIGKDYVVYARYEKVYNLIVLKEKVPKFLFTNICTRTTYKTEEEIKKIKEFKKPCNFYKILRVLCFWRKKKSNA